MKTYKFVIDFWKSKYSMVIVENDFQREQQFLTKKQMHDFAFSLMKQGYKRVLTIKN